MKIRNFKRSLAAFRKHALLMRELGYQHVSVQYDGNTFHVEGLCPPSEHVGGIILGEEVEEEDFDRLGRG